MYLLRVVVPCRKKIVRLAFADQALQQSACSLSICDCCTTAY